MNTASSDVRALSDQEVAELRALDHQLAKHQLDLGAAQFEIMQLQEKQAALAKLIAYASQQKMQRVREIALVHGIDPNDVSSTWTLDIHASKVAFERSPR